MIRTRSLLAELERLTRRFTSELLPIIGPQEDIPAPDMATNEQTMAWMMDTYSMQRGYAVPEIVTGKADLDRRVGLPARGDRRRGRHGDRARLRPTRLDACRSAVCRPGLRERRWSGGRRASRARGERGRRFGRLGWSSHARPDSTSRAAMRTCRPRLARGLRRRRTDHERGAARARAATSSCSPPERIRSPRRTPITSARG